MVRQNPITNRVEILSKAVQKVHTKDTYWHFFYVTIDKNGKLIELITINA